MRTDDELREMRYSMPLIFQLGKLHIRHNSEGTTDWHKIINVYWDNTHLFSKTPNCYNFALFNRVIWLPKRNRSIGNSNTR